MISTQFSFFANLADLPPVLRFMWLKMSRVKAGARLILLYVVFPFRRPFALRKTQ